MALALDASLHVADIAQIYSNVGRDYTLGELCIMSRFRPITPEEGGIEPIVSTACVSHQRQDTAAAAERARARPIQP